MSLWRSDISMMTAKLSEPSMVLYHGTIKKLLRAMMNRVQSDFPMKTGCTSEPSMVSHQTSIKKDCGAVQK